MSWNNVLPAEMFMDDEPIAHSHYFKDVSQLSVIDVYRTLILFGVTDPCIQHAVKKLLVAGGRGAGKDISQDIQEAIDSLERWKQMREEENPIYNRRSEDNISLVGFPEVKYEDTYQDEPSEQPSENLYNTAGKFKEGDKVRIFNVTDSCIPKEFEGAEGIVIYTGEHDYSVKFDQEHKYNPHPVWCVWERQMKLVESPIKFNVGDVVRVIRLVPGVPEHTYNLEGKITDLYQKGEISEHYQVTFPDLDNDRWYFAPDEIEHV